MLALNTDVFHSLSNLFYGRHRFPRLGPFPSIICTAFLMAALAVVPPVAAQTCCVTFRGRVLDPTRAVVPKAKVTSAAVDGRPGPATISDQSGEFALVLEPGKYILQIAANGFSDISRAIEVRDGSQVVDFVLSVAQTNTSISIVESGDYQVEAISSATRTPTLLRDIPQSVSVIPGEQIKDQMMLSVGDVAQYIPGVTSHQGENNRDQLVIRGNSSSADFFLNGVRDDVQYYRDLYNLERIEALKGPNAMTFGRGGGGGVINRVTKEAALTPLRELSLLGGAFAERRFTGDFDQPLTSNLAFRLNGMYEASHSFRKYVDLSRFAVNPTVTFVPTRGTSIKLAYEFLHDRRTADRGIPSYAGLPLDAGIDTYFGNPNDSHVRADVHLGSALVTHEVGRWSVQNRTLIGDYDRGYQNYVPGAVNAARTLVSLSAYNSATQRRNLLNQTTLTSTASTGRIRHVWLAGLEFGRQQTDNFRNTGFFNQSTTTLSVALADPVISTPATFRQSATDADNHVTTNLAAVFLQDQLELNKRIELLAGLRFDHFDLQFRNNRSGEDLGRIDRLVSPRAGIVFRLFPPVSLYGTYTVSYLPSAGDQFSSLTTVTEQVKPEKFNNYEVGLKWDIRRDLALTAAIYRLDRTNTRSIDPIDPARIIQTGRTRNDGFELGWNGRVVRSWRIAGGYAYQDSFIARATTASPAGKQVAQVPHHTFSLWNNYRIVPRVGTGLGIIHRSDMFAAVDNTVVLPGYTRADAALYVTLTQRIDLQVNVENLLGAKYYLNADGNNNISPGSSRAVRMALRARF